jgi:hypothetical protein
VNFHVNNFLSIKGEFNFFVLFLKQTLLFRASYKCIEKYGLAGGGGAPAKRAFKIFAITAGMLVGGDPIIELGPHYRKTPLSRDSFPTKTLRKSQDMIYTKPMIKNRMPIALLILLGSLLSCAPEITPELLQQNLVAFKRSWEEGQAALGGHWQVWEDKMDKYDAGSPWMSSRKIGIGSVHALNSSAARIRN